ncbi:MAG TPA: hypothetical protein PKK43_14350 [Spirochaetota bacterium]|nr:hypothetical protein [Spirochaetota bacterium]
MNTISYNTLQVVNRFIQIIFSRVLIPATMNVIAGARLCENVPGEREWLLEMVGRYVRERR